MVMCSSQRYLKGGKSISRHKPDTAGIVGLCCVDYVVEHNREILRIGERKAKAVLAQIHHLNHLSCDMIALQAAGGVIREMEDDITAAGFDLLKETVGIRDQKNFQHKIIPFYYGTVYVNRVSTAIEYIYQRGVLEVVDITVLTRGDWLDWIKASSGSA